MTRQIFELASYTDPAQWATNIEYDGSSTQFSQILHQTKRFIKSAYPIAAQEIEKATSKTLYNSLKEMPLGNCVILLHKEDASTMESIVKLFVKNDKMEDGRYNYIDH